jgi:uncharacterized protein YndB with AHSA1/START domain
VPNRRTVYDNGFETRGAERMIVTITFDEHGSKTTLTIRTLFATVRMRNSHMSCGYEQGTNSGLDPLADLVAELGTRERAGG